MFIQELKTRSRIKLDKMFCHCVPHKNRVQQFLLWSLWSAAEHIWSLLMTQKTTKLVYFVRYGAHPLTRYKQGIK